MTRPLFALIQAFLLCFILAVSVSAATFVVDTEADTHDINPGDGIASDNENPLDARVSLRVAIEESNALTGPDTILIPDDTMRFDLLLESLRLTDNGTVILGISGFPILDGAHLDYGSPLMEVLSDSNQVSGLTFKRSRSHGIVITGSANIIGGTTNDSRNLFLGCGLDYSEAAAIAVVGEKATGNEIRANWIGLTGNGSEVYGNRNGILISDGANENTIGYDLIDASCYLSGSEGWGIAITNGSHENNVHSTMVGLDISQLQSAPNRAGGILIEESWGNKVGGDIETARNQISGNGGWGLVIQGKDAHNNLILGNYIGLEETGLISIANQGGILITERAHHNSIGWEAGLPSNLISGNAGDGVRIEGDGTDYNELYGNFVGPSSRGGGLYAGDTYSENGVVITDGARYNRIGSSAPAGGNVISLNYFAGLLISGSGTMENSVVGNFIGVSFSGGSSAPNGSGVVIRGGASHNLIGGYTEADRNLISGNRANIFPWGGGVVLYDPGTSYNTVIGNYIGTDYNGTRALRNGSSGVLIGNGASFNLIGGSENGAGNLISGNGDSHDLFAIARGVTLMGDETAHNRVEGNLIGLKSDFTGFVDNWGHGVGIFDGAHDNRIGGDETSSGNLIAGNEGYGIISKGALTERNLFRNNLLGANDSGAIILTDGANHSLAPPELSLADGGLVIGRAHGIGITIDVYRFWHDPLTGDLNQNLLGSGLTGNDSSFVVAIQNVMPGDSVWAIATLPDSSSSPYSNRVVVQTITSVTEPEQMLPHQFSLAQNYPNPFNPSTMIRFTLPYSSNTSLTIYNLTGQEIARPLHGIISAGEHAVSWNGSDNEGNEVASGIYFYRLRAGDHVATRSAILIR